MSKSIDTTLASDSLNSAAMGTAAKGASQFENSPTVEVGIVRDAASPFRQSIASLRFAPLLRLHQGLAINLSESFSAWLTSEVEFNTTKADFRSLSASVASDREHVWLEVQPASSRTAWLLAISNRTVIGLVNRLLGIEASEDNTDVRDLTGFENRIAKQIGEKVCLELEKIWNSLIEGHWACQTVRPTMNTARHKLQEFVQVSIAVNLDGLIDTLEICIPRQDYLAMESKLNKLVVVAGGFPTAETRSLVAKGMEQSVATLVVSIGGIQLTAADLAELQIGDVIVTEKSPDSPLDVAIEGVVKLQAKPGAIHGKKAIQIISAWAE